MATGGSSWWRSTMTFDILFFKIVTLHLLILKRQQNGKNKKTEYDDRVGAVNDVMCYEVQRCNYVKDFIIDIADIAIQVL